MPSDVARESRDIHEGITEGIPQVPGPLFFFAIVWGLAWWRYNQADGTVMDLIIWGSVGMFVYVAGGWLLLHFT